MARETKQERIARGMFDQVNEHLIELKNIETSGLKESDVEKWCQSLIKNCLNYTASDGYVIKSQETKGKMRPDLIIEKQAKPQFVVEVKRLGFDLNKSDFRSGKTQLAEYLSAIGGVRWGILSNGYELRLFDFSNQSAGAIEVLSIDFRNDSEQLDTNKKHVEEICFNLVDFCSATFESDEWDEYAKEATAFSPESLAKALLSHEVVKQVSKSIRGEHEFKANVDVLIDNIYELLSRGLDDSICDWNEIKKAELLKFIKSQKRASRRTRRTAKQTVETTNAVVGGTVANVQAPVQSTEDKPNAMVASAKDTGNNGQAA